MDKNLNFGQKFKVWLKISILVKKFNFDLKSKILVKNPNRSFRSKLKISLKSILAFVKKFKITQKIFHIQITINIKFFNKKTLGNHKYTKTFFG